MTDYEQAVFISYAWGGEREEIVNQIDQTLHKRGVKIIRDKRDLGYKGSISEFMERIGQGNCVIVVISDKYLRSPNCMFELVEIADGKQFHDRIFPIVLADANIYDPIKRIEYVRHWEVKRAELADAMRTLDPANLQGIRDDMDLYDRIRDKISGLTSILKDMNTLTPDMHRDADFNEVYDGIMKRMQETARKSMETTPAANSSENNVQPVSKKERKAMDPITLATAATSLLAPFIKKAGAAALDKLAEQLPDTVGKVWNAITNKSSTITEAASDLAQNPEDADNEVFFKKQLQKLLERDQEFASQLTDLIEKAKSDPSINIGGDGVVANNNSTAVGKVSVGGNVNGNFVIGNNNQVSSK
jgi:hypothetical protein